MKENFKIFVLHNGQKNSPNLIPNFKYMKTNKIYITLWVILSLLLVWYIGVEAKNSWYYQKYFGKNQTIIHSWSLENIAKSDLSEKEKELILFQYTEEKVAHDLYTYFDSLYKNQVFENIANSESKHMQEVKVLIDRYSLEVPNNYWVLEKTYNELKTKWEKSLNDALEVGIQVEMLDIEDVIKTIKITDNDDIKAVLLNIWWASYNHLRWFAKNVTTNIDYSAYLSQDELNIKWWALKNKLLQRLESEWITFSDNVKNNLWNCDNEYMSSWNMHNWNHEKWHWRWNLNKYNQ